MPIGNTTQRIPSAAILAGRGTCTSRLRSWVNRILTHLPKPTYPHMPTRAAARQSGWRSECRTPGARGSLGGRAGSHPQARPEAPAHDLRGRRVERVPMKCHGQAAGGRVGGPFAIFRAPVGGPRGGRPPAGDHLPHMGIAPGSGPAPTRGNVGVGVSDIHIVLGGARCRPRAARISVASHPGGGPRRTSPRARGKFGVEIVPDWYKLGQHLALNVILDARGPAISAAARYLGTRGTLRSPAGHFRRHVPP